jgi:hypothetical protein
MFGRIKTMHQKMLSLMDKTSDIDYLDKAIDFCKSTDGEEFDILVAGKRIRFYVKTGEIRSIIEPAFLWCIQPPASEPDVRIFIHSGLPFPSPSWGKENYLPNGIIGHLDDGDLLATYDSQYQILSMYNRLKQVGIFWCLDVAELPEWEFGAPMRNLISWALMNFNLFLIHAAGVGTERGGVLIAGPSGAGKSTSTMACIKSGLKTVGDDYCVMGIEPIPMIYGLYGLAKIHPNSMSASMVNMSEARFRREDGKVHIPLNEAMITEMPLRTLVIPRITQNTLASSPISSRESFLKIAANNLIQSTLLKDKLFLGISAMTKAVPSHVLDVGPNLLDNVLKIRELTHVK